MFKKLKISHDISAYFLAGVLLFSSVIFSFPVKSNAIGLGADCYVIGCGVGGRFAPGALPPFGDGDVLIFDPFCGGLVTIIGPEGSNWGTYVWAMPVVEPPSGPPHDYWAESYITNAWPYTHAGEYALGYAIPNPDVLCPPLYINTGTSLLKAGF